MKRIQTKRVYEKPEPKDGCRVLVDRVWPRGLTKEKVRANLWLKDIAPGNGLRKWFNHDPARWKEFKRRYFKELDRQPETIKQLLDYAGEKQLTLLYSAKDTRHNQAEALKEYLESIL